MKQTSRRPRLIIVEGPDGAGKTTLVEHLLSVTKDSTSIHCGVPDIPPTRYFTAQALEGWWSGKDCVIFDRFHLSEQVYGPIMRGGDGLGEVGRVVIEDFITAIFRPVVVVARPEFATCEKIWSGRHTEEYVKTQASFKKVWERYATIRTSLKLHLYDYENESDKAFTRLVKELAADAYNG